MSGFKKFVAATFIDHPREAGETYGQHLAFSIKNGCVLALTGFALICHGFVPRVFQTTASERIFKLYEVFKARWDKCHGCK